MKALPYEQAWLSSIILIAGEGIGQSKNKNLSHQIKILQYNGINEACQDLVPLFPTFFPTISEK
jgi:hypothetical protein